MKRGALLAALAAAACSSLGESGSPVAIEVFTPSPAVVDVGDTITLHARLLDQQGDSVGGTIRWRTLDSTLSIDSLTGRLPGASAGTVGRVQAVAGTLVGPITQFTVRIPADSVIITATADSILVLTTDTASAQLPAKVADSLGNGLSGRILSFAIVAPSPAGAFLTDSVKADTVVTGGDGMALPVMRVRKAGLASGDSVIVQVDARRPSGAAVPGSGQRIRVFIQ